MSADKLLSRLHGVKANGAGKWVARCPAHDDKRPSLSIRETEDGTILLKCWSGCGGAEIVSAVGLTMSDLFARPLPNRTPMRPGERWIPRDALKSLDMEATLLHIVATDIVAGRPLTPADVERVAVAALRFSAAASAVGITDADRVEVGQQWLDKEWQ